MYVTFRKVLKYIEFIFMNVSRNKISSCSDGSKQGAFIIGKSKEQFKIHSHFGIFDLVIG